MHAYEEFQAMKRIALIFLFVFAFFVMNSQAVSGETFAPVDMYISGGSAGQLRIENLVLQALKLYLSQMEKQARGPSKNWVDGPHPHSKPILIFLENGLEKLGFLQTIEMLQLRLGTH